MSEDWSAIASEVADGLAEAGFSAFLVKRELLLGVGSEHSPARGAAVQHPCTVVQTKWSKFQIDGSTIKAGDKKLLMQASGLSVEPEVGDLFWDGSTYKKDLTGRTTTDPRYSRIVDPVEVLAPGGVLVLYTLNIRDGG